MGCFINHCENKTFQLKNMEIWMKMRNCRYKLRCAQQIALQIDGGNFNMKKKMWFVKVLYFHFWVDS